MSKKVKLSDKQKEVILNARNGWQLGRSSSLNPRAWMQKGGLGKGGESKDISFNIWNALLRRHLIEQDYYSFPTSPYKLTELGKTISLNQ